MFADRPRVPAHRDRGVLPLAGGRRLFAATVNEDPELSGSSRSSSSGHTTEGLLPSAISFEGRVRMAKKPVTVLRRYTNLAATIHLLKKRKITLLDPATWDDKVDVDYMRRCSQWLERPVLALCFCQGPQRYHHWRVYANGMDGVCIEFDKDWLTHNLNARYDGLVQQDVTYRSYADAKKESPDVLDLLFLKRPAYEDEVEYRIVRIFDEKEKPVPVRDYDIDINCIQRIVLSPWMPKELSRSVTSALKSIDGCEKLDIRRSLLIDSEAWKKFGEEAYGKLEDSLPEWIASDSE